MSNVKNVGPRQSLMRHPLLREPEVSPQGSRSVVIAIIANDNSYKGSNDDDDEEVRRGTRSPHRGEGSSPTCLQFWSLGYWRTCTISR